MPPVSWPRIFGRPSIKHNRPAGPDRGTGPSRCHWPVDVVPDRARLCQWRGLEAAGCDPRSPTNLILHCQSSCPMYAAAQGATQL